jgi:hypothetical protein
MDLNKIPKHVLWIITPLILLPVGFLITALGVLVITYAYMLPNAKNITVDTPYLKIVSEFASQQIALNNDIQQIIAEASVSMQLLDKPVPTASAVMMNSSNPSKAKIIADVSSQKKLLEVKKQQLEKINHELWQVKDKIKMLQSNKTEFK